jgi:hypothetical protein
MSQNKGIDIKIDSFQYVLTYNEQKYPFEKAF